MPFCYQLCQGFPPMAWVATAASATAPPRVRHGRFVEVRDECFFEGAWAGDYDETRPHLCDTVFGSGAVSLADATVFVPCTATTDALFYCARDGHFHVANTLPGLLAVLDDALDPKFAGYSEINQSVMLGFIEYRDTLPTVRGQVHRLLHRNLRLDASGFSLFDKPDIPEFADFSEYRSLLQDRVARLLANARHRSRRRAMKIVSTQSRGYDSTAVNAIAAPYGVDIAYTCVDSKEARAFYRNGPKRETPSDDGRTICDVLGIVCEPIDRLEFRTGGFELEARYWAGLDSNQDINLHAILKREQGPFILLTGNYGEFWYPADLQKNYPQVHRSGGLSHMDCSGLGLSEVRLAAGMVQAAIPIIGSRHRQALARISDSEEMAPWRIGGRYDRPIPRRIAEEAGVPRAAFGQKKLASIVHFPTPALPVDPALAHAYCHFLQQTGLKSALQCWLIPLVQRFNAWVYWQRPASRINASKHAWIRSLAYYYARLAGHPLKIDTVWQTLDSQLFAFSVNRVRDDYVTQLGLAPAISPTHP